MASITGLAVLPAAIFAGNAAAQGACGPDYPESFPCVEGGRALPASAAMPGSISVLYSAGTISAEALLEQVRQRARAAGWTVGPVEAVSDFGFPSREFLVESGERSIVVNISASQAMPDMITMMLLDVSAPAAVAPDVLAAANAIVGHRVSVRVRLETCRAALPDAASGFDEVWSQWEADNKLLVELAATLREQALDYTYETEGADAVDAAERRMIESNAALQSAARGEIERLAGQARIDACRTLLESVRSGRESVAARVPEAAAKLRQW